MAWGSGDKEPDALSDYEVRVIDGVQRFREYPDGNKELEQVPYSHLNFWITPSDDWSVLPTMVGTKVRLKVHRAGDVVMNGRRIKIFQYYGSVEDNLCPFAPVEDFGFLTISKTVAVACYGEVWTDEDTNIIRMSKHLELSDKLKAYQGWEDYQIVLTYGWINLADEPPRLVPLTIFAAGHYKKKRVHWCLGKFTNYRMFTSRAKMTAMIPTE